MFTFSRIVDILLMLWYIKDSHKGRVALGLTLGLAVLSACSLGYCLVGMAKLRVANFEFEFELQIFNPFFLRCRCLTLQLFNPFHAFTVNSLHAYMYMHVQMCVAS